MSRRGVATLEEAEARMLSRKHAHEQLNGKLAALAAKGAPSLLGYRSYPLDVSRASSEYEI